MVTVHDRTSPDNPLGRGSGVQLVNTQRSDLPTSMHGKRRHSFHGVTLPARLMQMNCSG